MIKKNKTTGKWYCRYYIKDTSGKLVAKRKDGFADRSAAQIWELTHKTENDIKASDTFAVMFELMSKHNKASETTTGNRRQRLKHYAADLWNLPINKITKPALAEWRSDLEEEDLATQTKNDTINYVKMVFRYAWDYYDIPDPAKILRSFEKTLDDQHDYVIINYSQFQQLMSHEENDLCKDIFTAMFMLGCRKGEARALLKSDYDPNSKMIHITKSMRRYTSSLKTPKTRSSIRYVPVDNQTAEMFSQRQNRKGRWMFGDYTPCSLTMLQNHFKEDLEAAGLPTAMRIHDLRHSHVSMLWAAGVPVPEISKRIGHSSPAQTMKTYAHIFDNNQSASLAVLNALTDEKKVANS